MMKIPAAILALALFHNRQAAVDPRLKSVHYEADKVVQVQGRLGYQSMIEFGQVSRSKMSRSAIPPPGR